MKKICSVYVISTLLFIFIMSMGISSALAADKGKYGGTLIFNHSKTADVIGDPIHTRAWNGEFVTFVLQPLLKQNHDDPGIIEPNLATGWEMAEDKSTCIFKLRKGVKFHDGTDFNARAVKWNFDRYINSKGRAMDTVSSCEVLDDYTLKITPERMGCHIFNGLCKRYKPDIPDRF